MWGHGRRLSGFSIRGHPGARAFQLSVLLRFRPQPNGALELEVADARSELHPTADIVLEFHSMRRPYGPSSACCSSVSHTSAALRSPGEAQTVEERAPAENGGRR